MTRFEKFDKLTESEEFKRREAKLLNRIMQDRENFESQKKKAFDKAKIEGDKVGTFENVGIKDVPVKDINIPEKFRKGEDFQKYSREDIEKSLHNLPEVKDKINNGWNKDNFYDLWCSKNPHDLEIARTYDTYYGSECIKLSRDIGKPYEIVNGRHRLKVAKELGYEKIPAKVSERKIKT